MAGRNPQEDFTHGSIIRKLEEFHSGTNVPQAFAILKILFYEYSTVSIAHRSLRTDTARGGLIYRPTSI